VVWNAIRTRTKPPNDARQIHHSNQPITIVPQPEALRQEATNGPDVPDDDGVMVMMLVMMRRRKACRGKKQQPQP